jgi:hypothetical protein
VVGRFSCRKMLTKRSFHRSNKQSNGATGADASEALQRQQRLQSFPQTIVRENSSACGFPERRKLFITTKAWIVSSNPGRTVARF